LAQTLNLATKATCLANCVISSDDLAILRIQNRHSREIYHNDNVVLGLL